METNIKKKIGQATKWSSITEIFTKLISPVVNMVLARLLVPEAFGVVATITMVISFAEIFADAGFQKYLVQHEFDSQESLDGSTNIAFWTNLSISFFICIIIFLFRHQIARLVGNAELGNSISIASVLIILAAFSSIQMARYKREFDFKTLFFVRIGTSLIPIVVTVPLAFIFRSYWALLIGTFVRSVFLAVVLTVKSKWKPKIYYNFSMFKEMFSFSAWTLLESVSIWLTTNVDIFIVGTYLNSHYLGLYKTSITTINSYMSIITSAITPVLFSALSRYQNDDFLFKKTYYAFQRLTAIFVIPMGIGVYLFRDLVTRILLGNGWEEAAEFIGIWGLTSAFTIVFSYFASEVYRSKGKPKISLLMQLAHLVFLVPILFISVRHGFEALYTLRALVRIQMILSAMLIMRCLYKFKFFDVLKNVLPTIISAIIMAFVGYALKPLSDNLGWQIVSVLICIIVYFSALLLLFPKVRKEVCELSFVKKITKKL